MASGFSRAVAACVIEIKNVLEDKNFADLIQICRLRESETFSQKHAEECKDFCSLFQKLHELDIIQCGNISFVEEILKDIGRIDLAKKMKNANKDREDTETDGGIPEEPDQQQQRQEPKIFLSFSFTMKEKVDEFKKKIEDHTRKGIIWKCDEQIRGGEIMDQQIVPAISKADITLCAINEGFVNSKYCQDEVHLSDEKKKHIIPVLFDNVCWPLKKSDGTDSPLQRIFANCNYIDMRTKEKEAQKFQELIEAIKEYTDVGEQDSRDGGEEQNDSGNVRDSGGGGEGQSDQGNVGSGTHGTQAPQSVRNSNNLVVIGDNNKVMKDCVVNKRQ